MRPTHARIKFPSGRVTPVHVRPFQEGWWTCMAYGETLHRTLGQALNELGEALRNWGIPRATGRPHHLSRRVHHRVT